MAYWYNDDWNDYPPDWDVWLEQTSHARQIGAKVVITDKITRQIEKLKEVLTKISQQLALNFLEVLYRSGQAYPDKFDSTSERNMSLRADEKIFTHNTIPLPTLQKYVYALYHKALYECAERLKWETKSTRTKHKDWATNTKEYKKLEDKYEELKGNYESLIGKSLPDF